MIVLNRMRHVVLHGYTSVMESDVADRCYETGLVNRKDGRHVYLCSVFTICVPFACSFYSGIVQMGPNGPFMGPFLVSFAQSQS